METQFEVGKWYYADGFYSKFRELKDNEFCSNEYIHNGTYTYDEKTYFSSDWTESCNLVLDLSEIQQYLPDGHVDKTKEEWIPQVGDWVVLQESKDNWVTDMNKLVGKCVQITDMNKTYKTSITFQEKDIYAWYLEDKHFRKALPHEIPDNFVLPEKWCIKVNSENQEIVGNWFLTVFDRHKDINNHKSYLGTYYSYPVIKGSRDIIAVSQVVILEDYTEITLEQFKKYVLKEDSDVDKTLKILDDTGSIIYDGTLTGGYTSVNSYEKREKSSEIHIPKLTIPAKTPVKVVIDSGYPEINIKLNPKKVPVVDKLTIKPINILVK